MGDKTGKIEAKKLIYTPVSEVSSVDVSRFKTIQEDALPALMKGCDFGDCMHKWNLNYLNDKLNDHQVVIHESAESKLDFLHKNFHYRTCLFSEFVAALRSAQDGGRSVYLRSINNNQRKKKAANISEDFSAIAQDLKPPEFIPYESKDHKKIFHSSILRIASNNVQIWTHFDLYDNILCQVVGTKRVILIPPEDTKYLYTEGDKSRVNSFDEDDLDKCLTKYPLISRCRLYICHLTPGDCLYIPSLWWHNIKTTIPKTESKTSSDHYSLGFNIFWRDKRLLDRGVYAENDIYGNKNLLPYDAALANLDKALQHISKLPEKYQTLYKTMLHKQFKRKFQIDSDNDDHDDDDKVVL